MITIMIYDMKTCVLRQIHMPRDASTTWAVPRHEFTTKSLTCKMKTTTSTPVDNSTLHQHTFNMAQIDIPCSMAPTHIRRTNNSSFTDRITSSKDNKRDDISSFEDHITAFIDNMKDNITSFD